LLSGEYFVLGGAKALAIPARFGQRLEIERTDVNKGLLFWESLDEKKRQILSVTFSLDDFKIIKQNGNMPHEFLQQLLQAARNQQPEFLRQKQNLKATSSLEFPVNWGLGSSSTLIHNVASWSNSNPFKLLKSTVGGSGYDIACAGTKSAIVYSLSEETPSWKEVVFNPSFTKNIFFVHLGKKQDSGEAVKKFNSLPKDEALIKKISALTENMIHASTASVFQSLIEEHEKIVADVLQFKKVKDIYFKDFPGAVKSLGAWGGDFVMACSMENPKEIKSYFQDKGFPIVLSFKEIFLNPAG